jgi:hypothetical protein
MSNYKHLTGAANQLGIAEEPSTWFRLVPNSPHYPNSRISDKKRQSATSRRSSGASQRRVLHTICLFAFLGFSIALNS